MSDSWARVDTATHPPHERHVHAVRVLAETFGRVHDVVAHKTWGPTVVVEAGVDGAPLRVILKASSAQDVFTEMAAASLARTAGVPAPRVITSGRDPLLPGGRWFVMERARGQPWASMDGQELDFSVVLRHLGGHLRRLHTVRPPGHGWLDDRGEGRFASWRAWLEHVAIADIRRVDDAGFATTKLIALFGRTLAELAAELDRRRACLVHGDLGDREVIVDPETLRVTAIVDWGDAVIGDPLYEFARFVAGGPPDDPRPGELRPLLLDAYGRERVGEDTSRLRSFYEAHNAIRNAAWSVREEPTWTPGLIDRATISLRQVEEPS